MLLITGIGHVVGHLRAAAEPGGTVSVWRITSVTVVLAAYVLLIDRFGYALASTAFFVAMYWLFGVRRWVLNLPLSIGTAVVFYLVFIRFFQVLFPPGKWWDPLS